MSERKKSFVDFATGCWYTADLGFGRSRYAVRLSGLFPSVVILLFSSNVYIPLSTSYYLLL
jgi:hypothetical protein